MKQNIQVAIKVLLIKGNMSNTHLAFSDEGQVISCPSQEPINKDELQSLPQSASSLVFQQADLCCILLKGN